MQVLLILLFFTHKSNNMGNNSLLHFVKIHPFLEIPLFRLIPKDKEEISPQMMQASNSKWSVSDAIVILTKHTDGDLWNRESLGADFSNLPFCLQVTLLSMYFTYYTTSQSLQDTQIQCWGWSEQLQNKLLYLTLI